jgi:hypothetical protein
VTERILDLAVAVAPEHVRQRHDRLCARIHGLLPDRVGIVHIQVDEDRGAFQGQRAIAAPVGKVVGQHDARVADADLGVHDLAAWAGHAADLGCAEGLFIEVQGIGRTRAHKVGRDGVEAFGNGAYLLLHDRSPSLSGCFECCYHYDERRFPGFDTGARKYFWIFRYGMTAVVRSREKSGLLPIF